MAKVKEEKREESKTVRGQIQMIYDKTRPTSSSTVQRFQLLAYGEEGTSTMYMTCFNNTALIAQCVPGDWIEATYKIRINQKGDKVYTNLYLNAIKSIAPLDGSEEEARNTKHTADVPVAKSDNDQTLSVNDAKAFDPDETLSDNGTKEADDGEMPW